MPRKTAANSRGRARQASRAGRATKRATSRAASRTTRRAARPAAMDALAAEENHIDGCDIDFTASDVTADADLPAAKGGVESVFRKTRRT